MVHLVQINSDDSSECKKYGGFMVEVFDEAAKILNFTWSTEISNIWGDIPKSGPIDPNGVFGKVVFKDYPFSLSTWLYRIGRLEVVDFAILMKTRRAMYLVPSPPIVDSGFFFRPFKVGVK